MATWKIDPAHTDVLFSAKHLMVTTVRGTFDTAEGDLDLDEANPERSSGEIRFPAASLSTGNEARDGHLRSADFLDVEHHQWVIARATRIERKGDQYVVDVDLTIRGVTRPVALKAEFLGIVHNLTGGRHAGLHLTGSINREDWGLTWNLSLEAGGWLVGKEIRLEIDVAVDEVAVAVSESAEAVA